MAPAASGLVVELTNDSAVGLGQWKAGAETSPEAAAEKERARGSEKSRAARDPPSVF